MASIIKGLLGAASVLALVSSAHAADMVAPVAASGFNWSGFYLGVGGGVGAVNHRAGLGLSNGQQSAGLGSFNGIGGDGVFGEITAGYDHMLGERLLLGGFIDAQVSNIGPSLGASGRLLSSFLGSGIDADLTNQYGFDVGARLGYVLNPSTLGYVLGGYSWRHFKLDGSYDGDSFSFTKDRGGYMVGVGMETVVGSNWTIKTEYRYSDYGNPTVYSYDLSETTALDLNLHPSTHTFHIAANYRFGAQDGGGAAVAAPEYNWTGFYIGGALGAGEVIHDVSAGLGTSILDASLKGIGSEGIFGEASIGYDQDFGSWVGGVMLDARYSGIESKLDILGQEAFALKADYGFDVLGRVGMKVNESTLAYALGGYSWQHFKTSSPIEELDSYDWSSGGFSVGGGLETAVSTNMTLGLEYRYSRYSKKDLSADLGDLPADTVTLRPISHTVRLGLKYKFN